MLETLENWTPTVLPASPAFTPRRLIAGLLHITGRPETWFEVGLVTSCTRWKISSWRYDAPKAPAILPAQVSMISPENDSSAKCCEKVVRFTFSCDVV